MQIPSQSDLFSSNKIIYFKAGINKGQTLSSATNHSGIMCKIPKLTHFWQWEEEVGTFLRVAQHGDLL